MPASPTPIEYALQRPRLSLAVVLVGIPLACWVWVIAMARDMYGPMSGASAWMMTVTWDAPRLLLLWAMWAAMMAGMMLPTATPILLLYARSVRHREVPHPSRQIYAMGAGYTFVWALFSVGATVVQRVLAEMLLLTAMMEPASPQVAAGMLFLAGAYQFTPIKRACLSYCRSPIAMLSAQWREGAVGAFRMGVSHGVYCLGCCWAMMLLLFAGGVMNLVVIVALTLWVAVEKLATFGEQSARVSGALLLGLGVWMLTR